MNAELLTYLNFVANIAGPILVIAPLMKHGTRYWPALALIFHLYLALHAAVTMERFPPAFALLLSLLTASLVMLFGWVMTVVFRKREETLKRVAAEGGQAG